MIDPAEVTAECKAMYATADDRACTCHPDDMPQAPCSKKYALKDCRFVALINAVRIYTDSREAFPSEGFERRIEDAGWSVAEAYRQYRKSE